MYHADCHPNSVRNSCPYDVSFGGPSGEKSHLSMTPLMHSAQASPKAMCSVAALCPRTSVSQLVATVRLLVNSTGGRQES
jgi:hypothetical protein